MERQNQIIKTNKKQYYQIYNTKKYIPKVLSVRKCESCKKIIEYIPNRIMCNNCHKEKYKSFKFNEEEDIIIYN